jgi:hypothetical protein
MLRQRIAISLLLVGAMALTALPASTQGALAGE